MSAENSDDIHISEETINTLYKTAGEETDYTEAIFTYNHEIVVSEQKKTMIRSSLSRLGVNFTPASFQVSTLCHTGPGYCWRTASNVVSVLGREEGYTLYIIQSNIPLCLPKAQGTSLRQRGIFDRISRVDS